MTDQEILEKAIKKAIKKGFKIDAPDYVYMPECYFSHLAQAHNSWCVIFDHKFAQAFFGEFCIGSNGKKHKPYDFMCTPEWVVQLQNMVVEKYPIQFLKRFL